MTHTLGTQLRRGQHHNRSVTSHLNTNKEDIQQTKTTNESITIDNRLEKDSITSTVKNKRKNTGLLMYNTMMLLAGVNVVDCFLDTVMGMTLNALSENKTVMHWIH